MAERMAKAVQAQKDAAAASSNKSTEQDDPKTPDDSDSTDSDKPDPSSALLNPFECDDLTEEQMERMVQCSRL